MQPSTQHGSDAEEDRRVQHHRVPEKADGMAPHHRSGTYHEQGARPRTLV